jgi:hypothetical protein
VCTNSPSLEDANVYPTDEKKAGEEIKWKTEQARYNFLSHKSTNFMPRSPSHTWSSSIKW